MLIDQPLLQRFLLRQLLSSSSGTNSLALLLALSLDLVGVVLCRLVGVLFGFGIGHLLGVDTLLQL